MHKLDQISKLHGRKVAIIGGGMVGCETAIWLSMQGAEVTLLEKGNRIIPNEKLVPSNGGMSNLIN